MRYLPFLITFALTLCALMAGYADEKAVTPTNPLRGFTPNATLTISMRNPYFQVGTKNATATVKVDGPADVGTKNVEVTVTGPEDTDETVTLTLNGAPGSNEKDVTVNLPDATGEASYNAEATVDNEPLSDDDSTTGYTWSIEFDDDQIAAGGDQTTFVLSASVNAEGLAAPSLRDASENKDAPNTSNASFSVSDEPSDEEGKINGTLTAGNRVDSTKLQVDLFDDKSRNPSASVAQVWNPSGDGWNYPDEFEIGKAVEISYSLAMPDGPISGHSLQFRPTSIAGEEWDDDAGEDWDEDGQPDGEYVPVEYSEDDTDATGFGDWSSLIAISGKPEVNGKYAANMTVDDDFDFFVTEAGFGFYDYSVMTDQPPN